MEVTTSDSPAEGDAPNWSQLTHDVLCPLCEYNLRGIRNPRCPECGYPFAWPEVLDVRRQTHPYLFEHHPKNNIWSWYRTLRGTWWPSTFFRSLHPTQRSRLLRLLAFWLIGAMCLGCLFIANGLLLLQAFAAHLTRWGIDFYSDTRTADLTFDNTATAWLTREWQTHLHSALIPVQLIIPLAWPWVTFLTLMIFQWSMRRARVRAVHVLRCVLYSGDPVLPGLCFIPVGVVGCLLPRSLMVRNVPDGPYYFWYDAWLVIIVVMWLFNTYRLACAYHQYLRFHRPVATVVASQLITAMVVVILLFVTSYVPQAVIARSLSLGF